MTAWHSPGHTLRTTRVPLVTICCVCVGIGPICAGVVETGTLPLAQGAASAAGDLGPRAKEEPRRQAPTSQARGHSQGRQPGLSLAQDRSVAGLMASDNMMLTYRMVCIGVTTVAWLVRYLRHKLMHCMTTHGAGPLPQCESGAGCRKHPPGVPCHVLSCLCRIGVRVLLG